MEIRKEKVNEDFKLTRSLVLLMSVSSGLAVANLYYIQPLLSEIARYFNVSQKSIGFAPMLTQIGYALGMLFFVPLGDIRERRSTIVRMLIFSGISLLIMGLSFNITMLLFSSFAVGFTSVVPQLIVPFAAHLAPPRNRGKIIGTVMSGLLVGILVSRTFSGVIGSAFGWKAVYFIAVVMMFLLSALMKALLPASEPTSQISYGKLLKSLLPLLKKYPVLREASLSGAMLFGAFSAFWTSLVFLLETPVYNLGAEAAGLFGLIGVTGALAAPIVGKIADRKSPRFTVGISTIISILSYFCFWILGFKMLGLIIGVILLDIGTQAGQVSNQARIYALSSEARNRINTVYMVSYFFGGSLGTLLGSYGWGLSGWSGVCAVGFLLLAIAFVVRFLHTGKANKFQNNER